MLRVRSEISTGAWAESLVLDDLRANGLTLLEQNYRRKCGELDLIMRDGGTVVFVEVRYRASEQWGGALGSVTRKKQWRLANAASSYLKAHPGLARLPCRFDVVAVTGPKAAPKLKWIRSAFGTSR